MNSQEYWRKREEEWILRQLTQDQDQSKAIAKKLQASLDAIQKEIDANWERFAGREGVTLSEAKKKALKMDVESFARKAKAYVETKDFSSKANDELRLYNVTMRTNRLELLKSQIGLELIAMSDDLDQYMAETLTKSGEEEAMRQAGILGETLSKDYKKTAEEIANASFQGATFSQRIWGNSEVLKAELDRLLTKSLVQGRNPREMARELRTLFDRSQYEAERLMRTETARVQISMQMRSYLDAGITEYQFIAEPSACPTCAALNDKIFKVEDFLAGKNAPPMHPHCRCSTVPYFDEETQINGERIQYVNPIYNEPRPEKEDFDDPNDWWEEREKRNERMSGRKEWLKKEADRFYDIRLENAKSISESIKSIEKNGIATKGLENLDRVALDSISRGLDEVKAKYPDFIKYLNNKGMTFQANTIGDNYELMAYTGYTIDINASHFSNRDQYVKNILGMIESNTEYSGNNWNARSNEFTHFICHELGHAFDDYISFEKNGYHRFELWKLFDAKNVEDLPFVSDYGTTSAVEWYAETFAQSVVGEQTEVTKKFQEFVADQLTGEK